MITPRGGGGVGIQSGGAPTLLAVLDTEKGGLGAELGTFLQRHATGVSLGRVGQCPGISVGIATDVPVAGHGTDGGRRGGSWGRRRGEIDVNGPPASAQLRRVAVAWRSAVGGSLGRAGVADAVRAPAFVAVLDAKDTVALAGARRLALLDSQARKCLVAAGQGPVVGVSVAAEMGISGNIDVWSDLSLGLSLPRGEDGWCGSGISFRDMTLAKPSRLELDVSRTHQDTACWTRFWRACPFRTPTGCLSTDPGDSRCARPRSGTGWPVGCGSICGSSRCKATARVSRNSRATRPVAVDIKCIIPYLSNTA
jgi:hypothetical protein